MPLSEISTLPLYSLFKQRIAPVPRSGPARPMAETITEPERPAPTDLLADFRSHLSRDRRSDEFRSTAKPSVLSTTMPFRQPFEQASGPFSVLMIEHTTPIASLSKHLSRLVRRITQAASLPGLTGKDKWLEIKRD